MQYIAAIIFAAFLIIIALCLRKGKGIWLIAGFNIMTSDEQKKYDIVAVSKFLSKILIGLAICLLAFDFGWYIGNTGLIVLSWLIFAIIVIFALIYSCGDRFKKNGN